MFVPKSKDIHIKKADFIVHKNQNVSMKGNIAILKRGTVCMDEPERRKRENICDKEGQKGGFSLSRRCQMVPPQTLPKGLLGLFPWSPG